MSASPNRLVVIKDACIFFDLMDLGLLTQFYRLKLTVVTTPQVLNEITDENQLEEVVSFIEIGKLHIDSIGRLDLLMSITDSNPGLSLTDASVLEVASRRNASVLSSDKSLRNESSRQGITARGFLWIMEELFLQGVIDQSVLIEKLTLYPEVNRRAPKAELQSLIKKYKS